MGIDIYGMYTSAPCRAVFLTAEALGVKLNLKEVNVMTGDHLKPEFVKINPQHSIPVIHDNGLYLNESRAIMMYLVNAYGKSDTLYPKPAKPRALVDQRIFYDVGLFGEFEKAYYPAILRGQPINQDSVAKFNDKLKVLDEYLNRYKYAAGDTLTIADFGIMASLATFNECGIKLNGYKTLFAYFNTCKKEIRNYDELNDKGAKMFGALAKPRISSSSSS